MAPEAVTRITESLFAEVAEGAAASPRQRKNHNLHQESDLVQRFLNVLQPGTYVRPHRHRRGEPGQVLSVLWCCKAMLYWCSIAPARCCNANGSKPAEVRGAVSRRIIPRCSWKLGDV